MGALSAMEFSRRATLRGEPIVDRAAVPGPRLAARFRTGLGDGFEPLALRPCAAAGQCRERVNGRAEC